MRRSKGLDYIFSPGLNRYDVDDQWKGREQIQFCKTWADLIAALERKHGTSARVCVFPCGSIQYPSA